MESFKDVYRKLFLRGHDPKNEEMFFATFGMVAVGVYNFVSRRPFYSKIYQYPMAGLAGWAFGYQFYLWKRKRIIMKEQAIWDYVNSHPEHFPDLKPIKYKDFLDVWHPIR